MSGHQPKMNVQWNNHLQSLGTQFPRMLTTQRFVDVTLACEGRRIHCHRVVLAVSSAYFEELLQENPSQHPIIILPRDVKFWAIEALVEFMYKGEVSVSQDNIEHLVKYAEMLQIRGLERTYPAEDVQPVDEEEPQSEHTEEVSPDFLVLVDKIKTESVDEFRPEVCNKPSPASTSRGQIRPNSQYREPHEPRRVNEVSGHPGHSSWDPSVNLEGPSRKNFPTPPEMPPNDFFIPKNLKRSYSRDDMWNALMSVKNGVSMQRAAREYKIPVGTLHAFMRRYGVQSCHLSYKNRSLVTKKNRRKV
ncbi:hypothetical protein DMENIID0001_135890 [Sergentomyia squamirostris]